MIKAWLIDVGGVLLRTEDASPRRELEREFGLGVGGIEALVFRGELGSQSQLGLISDTELWREVERALGAPPDSWPELRRRFWAGDRLDEALLGWIAQQQRAHQVAMLSNATDGLPSLLLELGCPASLFHHRLISAHHRKMKPDPAFFRIALDQLGCSAEECVFVDDFVENVAAACDLGFQTVHFTGPDVLLSRE